MRNTSLDWAKIARKFKLYEGKVIHFSFQALGTSSVVSLWFNILSALLDVASYLQVKPISE